eukprot:Nitzschia sp. Nitz4//scaffold288_size23661//14207//15406//NITZ4_008469-RA/size23661-processed-gene-0.39-mRNA-1//1//CDS//3329545797//9247//frame0
MTSLLLVEEIEKASTDPKGLVIWRTRLLENNGPGLPSQILLLASEATKVWLKLVHQATPDCVGLAEQAPTKDLLRILRICTNISSVDPTLNVELGQEGIHVWWSKLIQLDPWKFDVEETRDCVMEIQDIACEIAASCTTFPMKVSSFTPDELRSRLPLSFTIESVETSDSLTLYIGEVAERQSSQKDVGFLMWPSAVVLSRWLVTNPSVLDDKQVMELGAGCGLTGLVAGQIQQQRGHNSERQSVLLTDFNPIVVKNCQQNIQLNDLLDGVQADTLDFYQQTGDRDATGWSDSQGNCREPVDVILAADIICQPEDAFAAARTMACALRPGGIAYVVSADSKHRFGVERLGEACNAAGLHMESRTNVRDLYEGGLLTTNMEKTTGFVEDMSLTMYIVRKL